MARSKKPTGPPADFHRTHYPREPIGRGVASDLCIDLHVRFGCPARYTAAGDGHDITLPAEVVLTLLDATRPPGGRAPKKAVRPPAGADARDAPAQDAPAAELPPGPGPGG